MSRFYFKEHRQSFVISRGWLRRILARYLPIPAEEIDFVYSPLGKPGLATSNDPATGLEFNLAHSGNVVLYAFTRLGRIGIDVEQVRPQFACDEVANLYFSTIEIAQLRELPKDEQPQAFFNCWARKEAIIKAMGIGLSVPLHQFDVTVVPTKTVKLLRTSWDENEAARWSLEAVDVGPGYAAALAVFGDDYRLSHFRLDENGWNE